MFTDTKSAMPCGCDEGAGWTCAWHQRNPQTITRETNPRQEPPPAYKQELDRPTNPKQDV